MSRANAAYSLPPGDRDERPAPAEPATPHLAGHYLDAEAFERALDAVVAAHRDVKAALADGGSREALARLCRRTWRAMVTAEHLARATARADHHRWAP